LIPWWAKDAKAGYKMINARAESVADKPAFREPLQSRRCFSDIASWNDARARFRTQVSAALANKGTHLAEESVPRRSDPPQLL
jgi:putative SOS response-associated peptidase YedK